MKFLNISTILTLIFLPTLTVLCQGKAYQEDATLKIKSDYQNSQGGWNSWWEWRAKETDLKPQPTSQTPQTYSLWEWLSSWWKDEDDSKKDVKISSNSWWWSSSKSDDAQIKNPEVKKSDWCWSCDSSPECKEFKQGSQSSWWQFWKSPSEPTKVKEGKSWWQSLWFNSAEFSKPKPIKKEEPSPSKSYSWWFIENAWYWYYQDDETKLTPEEKSLEDPFRWASPFTWIENILKYFGIEESVRENPSIKNKKEVVTGWSKFTGYFKSFLPGSKKASDDGKNVVIKKVGKALFGEQEKFSWWSYAKSCVRSLIKE